jgi:GT2 family glycosyltransferase
MRRASICLVDNQASAASSTHSAVMDQACREFGWIELITLAGHGNVGYGRGNNLAIARCGSSDFHLVLNPDVKLAVDALTHALSHLAASEDCALLSPVATAPNGEPLYLVKRFPTLFTLALRGLAPRALKGLFRARLDGYERKETAFDAEIDDAKIVSGCFMLIRRKALDVAQGFDPNFFLYFEDFDLSYRISKFASVTRVAEVRIVHAGGGAARKGWRHVLMFVRSAIYFQWKHR